MESEAFDALFDRVRAAAFTDDVGQRGWEAVRTAALLRQHERYETALALLDDIVDHFRHDEIEAAAYACAVAIHCDRGEPATGLSVGLAVWARNQSLELGHALARAHWERFEQTDLAHDRDAWLAFKDELDAVHGNSPAAGSRGEELSR
jgi:hypothetical protein